MKINAIKAMIIASLIIICLYVLGLFLPIMMKSKDSKLHKLSETKLVFIINRKIISL